MEEENLVNKYLPSCNNIFFQLVIHSLSLSSSSFPFLFLFRSFHLLDPGSMLRKPKICDLDSAGRRVVHHENILQLQVSVADILTVHLGDGVGNLPLLGHVLLMFLHKVVSHIFLLAIASLFFLSMSFLVLCYLSII